MKKINISLQPSEAVVARSAAAIYAAYVAGGLVAVGKEKEFMQKAVDEAVWIARTVDEAVHSDGEMG